MAQLPVELILVRQLAHGLAVPTFVVDAAGDLVFVNEAAESLLGLDFEDGGPSVVCRLDDGVCVTDKGAPTSRPGDASSCRRDPATDAGTRTATDRWP